jgi:hypothetical protein
VVDIFDEVEEELRAERMQKLAMRYGGVLVAIALGIVGAAGGWKAWQWWQAKQDASTALSYIHAMEDTGTESSGGASGPAANTFERIATDSPAGYRVLARLNAAALKARSGDLTAASALWDQVAADSTADAAIRGLATLLWAQHALDHGDPSAVAARLQPLVGSKTWSGLAQEQLALLSLRRNDLPAAREMLRKLQSDPAIPNNARGRIAALLSRIGE